MVNQFLLIRKMNNKIETVQMSDDILPMSTLCPDIRLIATVMYGFLR